jgi:ubiquinone/menaquinone biosynthesis C-methylase UbiE
MESGWQLTGKGPAAWQRYLVPVLEGWAHDLVRRAALRPGQRVLDVGTGTGLVARVAAPEVRWTGSVTGVDVNPAMLEVAREAAAFVHPPIEWAEGDAAALPFPDGSFDAVLSQLVLMFVPDRGAALREMRRVTAPGGRMAFSVLRGTEHNPGWRPLIAALDRHAGKELGDMYRAIFALGDAAGLREAVEGAGWTDVRLEIRVAAARYPSARELVRWELESAPVPALWEGFAGAGEAIVRDVEAALADYRDDRGIVFPAQGYVVEAAHRP